RRAAVRTCISAVGSCTLERRCRCSGVAAAAVCCWCCCECSSATTKTPTLTSAFEPFGAPGNRR
uniref:Uncharacterized protein n=1 Tax=Anopheles quadriannulatus TaxID=34691 RepID=A0A182XS77_ANOQN